MRIYGELFGVSPNPSGDGGGGGGFNSGFYDSVIGPNGAATRYTNQFGYGEFPNLKVDGITTANPANTAAKDSDLSKYGYTPASQQFPTGGFLVDPATIAASWTGVGTGINATANANATARPAAAATAGIPQWMWWALGASVLAVVISGD
ncbi:MAG: hypothetical protein JWO13_819 [Acidobacteriales bacterium]|nr:hypothetical protein [Terriglobales bacterium]